MLAMVVLDNSYVFGIDLIVFQSHSHHPGGRAEISWGWAGAPASAGHGTAAMCRENRAGYQHRLTLSYLILPYLTDDNMQHITFS